MALIQPSEHSNGELELYWLSPPPVTFVCLREADNRSLGFSFTILWPHTRSSSHGLDSPPEVAIQAPPINRLLSWGFCSLQR